MTYWHKNIIFIVGRVVGASGSFGSFGLVVLLGKVLLSYYSFCHQHTIWWKILLCLYALLYIYGG